MKKLIFAFAILFSTTLISCGHSETTPVVEAEEVTDSISTDSLAVDSIAIDSIQ